MQTFNVLPQLYALINKGKQPHGIQNQIGSKNYLIGTETICDMIAFLFGSFWRKKKKMKKKFKKKGGLNAKNKRK